jgi:ribonuclease HI
MHLEIYTDGGCSGNPGPGGWAYVILGAESGADRRILAERWGAEAATTNNRMELQAAVSALESLAGLNVAAESVTVYTDSQYMQKGISAWIHTWKRNGWKTSDKKPVKNRDLWLLLDELAARFRVTWRWVQGHAGNEFNERCDRMTRTAVASLQKQGNVD